MHSVTTKDCLGLLTETELDFCEKFFGAATNKQRKAIYDKTPRPAKIFLAVFEFGRQGIDALYDRLTKKGQKREKNKRTKIGTRSKAYFA